MKASSCNWLSKTACSLPSTATRPSSPWLPATRKLSRGWTTLSWLSRWKSKTPASPVFRSAAPWRKRRSGADPSASSSAAKPASVADAGGKVVAVKNWPSFRGQFASGNGDGQFPPLFWNAESGANILWKTPIPGLGHSSPIVWGERIFVTTAISGDPKSQFKPGQYGNVNSVNDSTVHTWKVYCLDKRTGKIVWERTACQGIPKVKHHTKASHANPTPATDGVHVVASFGSEGVYCYDFEGKLLWKQNLGVLNSGWFYDPDYQWGFASSPIVYKNLAIVQCDIGKNSFIAAYNLADGSRTWVTSRNKTRRGDRPPSSKARRRPNS